MFHISLLEVLGATPEEDRSAKGNPAPPPRFRPRKRMESGSSAVPTGPGGGDLFYAIRLIGVEAPGDDQRLLSAETQTRVSS